MVYKKTFICLFSIVFVSTIAYFSLFHTRYNRNFESELNNAIINLVEQVINVQYRTHCEETLKKIFTEELLENYDDYHPHFFREESFFVNRNFMESLHYRGDNEWSVSVGITEGGFLSGHSFFLHITVVKTEEGSYLIHVIGRDA